MSRMRPARNRILNTADSRHAESDRSGFACLIESHGSPLFPGLTTTLKKATKLEFCTGMLHLFVEQFADKSAADL